MPAASSRCCVVAFKNGTGIDVTFLSATVGCQKCIHLLQLGKNNLMVIIAPSVTRDLSCSRFRGGHRPFPLPVVHCDHDNRTHSLKNLIGVTSFCLTATHPFHFPSVSLTKPLLE